LLTRVSCGDTMAENDAEDKDETAALSARVAQCGKDLTSLLAANDHMSASCCLGATADALLSLGNLDGAVEAQRRAVDETRKLDATEHPDRDWMAQKRLEWIADKLYEAEDKTEEQRAEVRRTLAAAMRLVPNSDGGDDESLAKARVDYFYDVVACVLLGPDAIAFFVEETKPRGALEHSNTFEAWCELGDALRSAGRERFDCKRPAIEAYKMAAERGDAKGDRRARFADTSRGLLCIEIGEYDEAIECHSRCVVATRTWKDHPALVKCLGNLGYGHASKGEYERAIEIYKEALAHAAEHCADDPSCARGALHNLSASLQLTGRFDAVARVQVAMEMMIVDGKRAFADRDEHEIKRAEGATLSNRAALLLKLGRNDESIKAYEKALELAREAGDSLAEAQRMGSLGCAYRWKGEEGRARELLGDAVERLEKLGAPEAALFASELQLVNQANVEGTPQEEKRKTPTAPRPPMRPDQC